MADAEADARFNANFNAEVQLMELFRAMPREVVGYFQVLYVIVWINTFVPLRIRNLFITITPHYIIFIC